MKIRNKQLAPPKPVNVVIYREDEDGKPDNIIFQCGPVLDYVEFERLCPEPKPPLITNIKAGTSYHDPDDSKYKINMLNWGNLKLTWMMLSSLKATPDLEWETVKYDDPTTWKNWEKELKASLTESEFDKIRIGVYNANAPTENRRKEAMDVFTQSQAAEGQSIGSQLDVLTSTPSTEPANG